MRGLQIRKGCTDLEQECENIATDKYLCHFPRVHDGVLRADVGNKMAVSDVVESQKSGGGADNEELLNGEETEIVVIFSHRGSENEAEGFALEGSAGLMGLGNGRENFLQYAPMGRHKPHHALDLYTLNERASAIEA